MAWLGKVSKNVPNRTKNNFNQNTPNQKKKPYQMGGKQLGKKNLQNDKNANCRVVFMI